MYTPIAPLKYFDKWFNLTLGGTWSTEMFLTNASTCWPWSAHINILSWCRDSCGDPFRHFFWELVSQYTNPVFKECCTIYKSWKSGAQWIVLPRIGFFGTLEPCVIISVKILKFFCLGLGAEFISIWMELEHSVSAGRPTKCYRSCGSSCLVKGPRC